MTEAAASEVRPDGVSKTAVPLAQERHGGLVYAAWAETDKTLGWMSVQIAEAAPDLAPTAVDRLLIKAKLAATDRLRAEALAAFERFLAAKPALNAYSPAQVVARGKPPLHGEHGRLEWNVEIPSVAYQRMLDAAETANAAINFRERRRVVCVVAQQALCRLIPPTPGTPGADVFGAPIAPNPGSTQVVQVKTGVELDENDPSLFRSKHDGCVRFERDELSVDPVYLVEQDVDFQEGNITFSGSVLVKGEVKPGFEVAARDTLEIGGVADRCSLKTGAGMTLTGGYTGNDQARVICGGPLSARYLTNARVDVVEDCVVQSQIINSRLNAQGRVIVSEGAVVGGKISALGGMDLPVAGAANGTRTELVVSAEGFENEELRQNTTLVADLEEKLAKIERHLGPILADEAKLAALDEKKKAVVLQLIEQSEKMEAQVEAARAQRNGFIAKLRERMGNSIIIRKKLHPGVLITIDTCRQAFTSEFSGPICLKPNYGRGTIQISAI